MNILNKLTMKHLLLNKKRTIMSIVGIILSTALMVGVGLLSSAFREYMVREIEHNNGRYNSKIENVEKSKLSIIKNNNNIDTYFYDYLEEISSLQETEDNIKPYYYIQSVSNNYLKELKLLEGNLPTKDNEILITNTILYETSKNYKTGDTIDLNIGKRYLEDNELTKKDMYIEGENFIISTTKTYKIVGIIERSPYEDYSQAGYNVYKLDNNKDNNLVNVYMIFKDPSKTIELSKIISKNIGIEDLNIDYNSSLLSMYGASNYNNVQDFIVNFLSIFLLIISVACIIVIYNGFAISVMERKKQFGLFSSIGATKNQLRKTVFFEALIVGTIGIILGILSAYIGIGLLILILNNLLKEVLPLGLELVTYKIFIIIPIIFIIAVIIISAFLPARRASKISPIEVIRQNDDIKIKRRKLKTPRLLSRLFGVEGDIALKNIKRNKKKYRITIISLFISIVTFIAFSSYLYYGISTAEGYLGEQEFNILIEYNSSKTKDHKTIIDSIINNKDIDEKIELTNEFKQIKEFDKNLYSKEYLEYIKASYDEENINLFEGLRILVLNNNDYKEYQKEIGLTEERPIIVNTITYVSYSNSSRKIKTTKIFDSSENLEYNICSVEKFNNDKTIYNNDGIINKEIVNDEYMNNYYKNNCYYTFKNIYLTNKTPKLTNGLYPEEVIIINKSMYDSLKTSYEKKFNEQYNDTEVFTYVLIKADKYDNIDKIAEKLKSNYFYYRNFTESKKAQDNLLMAVQILLYGFISLVTLIGVTSVFNTINTSINLRKREFSVLRSIGLTPKGFNKMIWYESIFFGLKALIYGIPVGIGLTYLIYKNMNELVDSPFIVTLKPILICIVGVFAIILITMWYSTSKIKKENILEAIREENI